MKKIQVYEDIYVRIQRPTKFIAIFIPACLLISAASLWGLHVVTETYKERTDALRYEILAEMEKSEYYNIEEEKIHSVDFIEKIAREELGYVGKDDIIFKVIDKAQLNDDEP